MPERWPQVCRVKITFRLLRNNWFVSTKTNSMKCFENWILLNSHVRFNKTQPYLKMFVCVCCFAFIKQILGNRYCDGALCLSFIFKITNRYASDTSSRCPCQCHACAAPFPGTKRICGNPSLFAGISKIFSIIPGNPLEMEFLYQEKVFVAERVSGNEQLGSNS